MGKSVLLHFKLTGYFLLERTKIPAKNLYHSASRFFHKTSENFLIFLLEPVDKVF